ncbi:B-cell receptor CD22 isoform X1 [Scophthalmus maximus]|uniref:B-cell receptor CD22 isoform X1 n=2 Tax=Scophthalmus maximus TaxID=52904 RepID=UPI0015E10BB7|nr:B-cell receptor CD22 isoform X1 [Scophthalmus maximus]
MSNVSVCFSWQIFTMESCVLIILVAMPGVWGGAWGVTFGDLCALKGTSVVMNCSYDYPSGYSVTNVGWSRPHYAAASGKWRLFFLSRLPTPPVHFEYVGDYNGNCNLKIHDVQRTDEGNYYFSFVTTLDRYTSTTPARLSVKELTAIVRPSTVAEGDDVSLTCVLGCPARTAVVWFRDGQRVLKPVFQARREDAGRYYCAVLGQETVRSASVVLNVQYAPKNVTLSVSPPRGVVQGSSVAFACASDANPPVTPTAYSLYKDGQFVSAGQSHTVLGVQPSHSGLYRCQAWNNVSWRGVDLMNSTEIRLDVQYGPTYISVSLEPQHAVEGSRVNLTCSAVANPAADNYTWWHKRTDSASSSPGPMLWAGSGRVLTLPAVEASHAGLYVCRARNSVGEMSSAEMLLTMSRGKRGSQPHLIIAGVGGFLSVTLVIALLWYRKQRTHAERKPAVFGSGLGVRGSSSPATGDQLDAVYANVGTSQWSPPLATAAQDAASRSQRSARHEHELPTSDEAEVTYSTVTIQPRNPSFPPRTNNSRAPQKCGIQCLTLMAVDIHGRKRDTLV